MFPGFDLTARTKAQSEIEMRVIGLAAPRPTIYFN